MFGNTIKAAVFLTVCETSYRRARAQQQRALFVLFLSRRVFDVPITYGDARFTRVSQTHCRLIARLAFGNPSNPPLLRRCVFAPS